MAASVCPCVALLLLLFAGAIPCRQAQRYLQNFVNPRYRRCWRNATTSLPAPFARDLNAALLNFTVLAAQGVAYGSARPESADSTGQDTLYAMFQCRGDLSLQSCSACVQNVTASLPRACPESIGADLGTEGCLLRYDNQSFFHLDTNDVAYYWNFYNTTNAVALTATSDVMQKVTAEAPKMRSLFAAATEQGVYAAAQCWAYLNETECSRCLTTIPYRQICDSRLGCQLHLGSCMYRFENYNFMDDLAFLPPPPSPTPAPIPRPRENGPTLRITTPATTAAAGAARTRGSNAGVIAGSVVVGVIVVVGALCGVLKWRHKANRIKGIKHMQNSASLPHQLFQNKAQAFSLKELEEATARFDPINRLGEGGFGVVYKGTLSNGQEVAIKKLSIRSLRKQDFLNEVNLLTSVQHRNLVSLLGYCAEGPELILVYEYMPNKSLDYFLYSRKNRKLNWATRFGIVVGVSKGLAYLHEESCVRIIHRDIKPGNVLLDDQLNPIIADFGLARLVKEDVTHINTGVAGTTGYLAPEYAVHGTLSEKVDVYSFGLVCLEIVTGKKNEYGVLLAWVWERYRDGHVLDVVDERLAGVFSPEQVVRVVHIALLCTQENPKHRPTMSTVALLLSGTSDILEIPTRPSFLNYGGSAASITDSIVNTSSTEKSLRYSAGRQSFTQSLDPR